ncbi:LysM peptidoglycan-binding domain-containing protein [Rothia aerolata]|uniref:LysM domain-containing protein n=1 Tax=Rothia aerolata TaxID=1812262 RepID=A0A917MTQ8_9MICC|nr:transglycosylase family protein [Rothia aerolata]GGH63231.1 hypothetical protein GCM10007359_14280 [Rothia aerolata]
MKKTSIRRNVTRTAAAVVLGGSAAAAFAVPANAASVETWDALAQCESGGNWSINTGNGFSGGLQFTPSTWAAFGGTGSPTNASKAEQIRVAENVLAGQGWGAWPACSAKLGLTASDASGTPNVAPAPKPATVAPQANQVEEVKAPSAPVVQEVPAAPAQEAPVAEAPAPAVVEAPAAPVAEAPAAPAVQAPAAKGTQYTVVAGDTLSEIALAHGISDWTVLAAANADVVPNPNVIEVGQVLTIPAV